MLDKIQPMNMFAGNQIDRIAAVADVFARGAERILAETQEFQSAALKNNSACFSKIVFAKTLSELIEAQTEHVRANYDATVAETRKIGELLTDLTRDAVKLALSGASPNAPMAPELSKAPEARTEARARREAA